ncbi:MAG: hypothetical protein LBH06_04765 [Rikenellaceae bacterium]|nr:hypothetical protein [Rikenellaceae bacterium]
MIDLITLINQGLSGEEIDTLVSWNGLQTNSKNGEVFYDNMNTKNLAQQKGGVHQDRNELEIKG